MGLTALSNSLLAGDSYFGGMTTRFAEFLFFGMTIARMARKDCSQSRGISARFASQWNSYLEYKASCIAPMGVEILFLLYFDFAQFDKAKKDCSGQRD